MLSSGWYQNTKVFPIKETTTNSSIYILEDANDNKPVIKELLPPIEEKEIYKVGIVIPVFNQSNYTIKCLNSIDKYYENKYEVIVILVDNGSDQTNKNTVNNCINELKNIKVELLEYPKPIGYVKATNAGITKALELECDYICLQNNDTEVSKNWMSLLINPIKDNIVGSGPTTNSKLAIQRI